MNKLKTLLKIILLILFLLVLLSLVQIIEILFFNSIHKFDFFNGYLLSWICIELSNKYISPKNKE